MDDGDVDVQALMIPLLAARVHQNGYLPMDRYRDFRAVFFGEATADQKERVLFQIFAAAGLHHSLLGLDTHDTYRLLGRREVGMEILGFLTREPDTGVFRHTTIREAD